MFIDNVIHCKKAGTPILPIQTAHLVTIEEFNGNTISLFVAGSYVDINNLIKESMNSDSSIIGCSTYYGSDDGIYLADSIEIGINEFITTSISINRITTPVIGYFPPDYGLSNIMRQ